MPRHAYITLATNDAYCIGACVLGQTLKNVRTSAETIALVTNELSPKMRQLMESKFDIVKNVDIVDGG